MTFKEELLRLKFGDKSEVVDSIKSAIEEGVTEGKERIAYIAPSYDIDFLGSWLSVSGFKYEVDGYDEFIIIYLDDFNK